MYGAKLFLENSVIVRNGVKTCALLMFSLIFPYCLNKNGRIFIRLFLFIIAFKSAV